VILCRTWCTKCTPQALEYFDNHLKEWTEKEKAKILWTNQSFGTIESKAGARDAVLFINIWYEKEA